MTAAATAQGATDVVIIGAGAAGLSLLLALDELGYTGRIKVLERRDSYQDDRIWSFWHTHQLPSYIDKLIAHKWSHWRLTTAQQHYLMTHSTYQYCSIRSEQLGAFAVASISGQDNKEICFDCEVLSIDTAATDDMFLITTATEQLFAKQIIDTRPPPLDHQHNGLLQCFYGEEIILDAPIFDPATVGLMNHLCHSQLGIEFVYILPFSANHALIELTCFSTDMVDKTELKSRFVQVIKDIVQAKEYRVVRTEQAVLPMYTINQNRHQSQRNFIYGGIAGGAMRAATGYSFLSNQRWAKKCASAIINQSNLDASIFMPSSRLYPMMDAIMLRVLRNNMAIGVVIFERMFKRVKPERFARFMTEQATLLDMLSVIWAMPKWVFLRTALRVIFNQIIAAQPRGDNQ